MRSWWTTAAWTMAAAIALSATSGCATMAKANAPRQQASQGVDDDDQYSMPTNANESTRVPQLTAF